MQQLKENESQVLEEAEKLSLELQVDRELVAIDEDVGGGDDDDDRWYK